MARSLKPVNAWASVQRGDAHILDVRTGVERRRYGAPPGAKHVSLVKHVANPEGPGAIYLCQRALRSKATLRRGAMEVEGGFVAWKEAGLPIEEVRSARARAPAAAGSGSVTVVLVDNQALTRRSLTQWLSAAGLEVVGEASTGEEGVRLVVDLRPDVVLTDLLLPGPSGVEMIQRLADLAPASRTLVLTGEERAGVVEAILAGASGYLLKEHATPEKIVAAVRATAAGGCVISTHVAADLLRRIRERDTAVTARNDDAGAAIRAVLTDRELEIFKRLASGESNQAIGRELCLSENTVKNHIASILAKLQLDNRIQAAVQAVRSGIS